MTGKMYADRIFRVWVHVYKAADKWIAHAMTFDVLGDGDSPQSALQSVHDLAHTVIDDDLCWGFDPYEDRSAPEEYWGAVWKVVRDANGNDIPINSEPLPAGANSDDQFVVVLNVRAPAQSSTSAALEVRYSA